MLYGRDFFQMIAALQVGCEFPLGLPMPTCEIETSNPCGLGPAAACGPALPSPCRRERLPEVVAIDEEEDDDVEELSEELPNTLDPVDDFEEDDFDDDFDDDFEEESDDDEDLDDDVAEVPLDDDEELIDDEFDE